ncbi:MAG: hypothetical protein QM820_36985 [Minicystis sp.]
MARAGRGAAIPPRPRRGRRRRRPPAGGFSRALADAPFTRIDALGEAARRGARARTARARSALLSLTGVEDAARHAGCAEALAKAAVARAARHRLAAVDEALAPIDEALAVAVDRGAGLAAAPEIFAQVQAAWIWSGSDEGVERFVADRAMPLLWDGYRAPGWDTLRALITPLDPLIRSLATRIEADPTQIAYAAPCAQLLGFMADVTTSLADEQMILERALKICPSHRNARAHLAFRLCEQAGRAADRWTISAEELARAEAQVQRAEQLFPACENLPEARRKVEAARGRRGGALA